MNEDRTHARMRELLGSYALGHLEPPDVDRVRAHLDGCVSCRDDLARIAPLAPLLDDIDPDVFASPPTPPPGLGDLIRAAVSAERRDEEESARVAATADALAQRRARRRTAGLVAAAAVLVLAAGVAVGGVVGRTTAPSPAAVPLEPIVLESVGADGAVRVSDANLIDHTWGVELRMEAAGFADGEVFRAAFRTEDGRMVPAGEFVGTGAARVVCNLQSSVLRDDVVAVVVRAADGSRVLRSTL